jgi:phosphoglycerate-specific signal transduction histidine kinase
MQALMQQTSDNLERLERSLNKSEESRHRMDATLVELSERLGWLGDHMREERDLLRQMVGLQQTALDRSAPKAAGGGPLLDEASRTHLRNTDLQMGRLIDEMARTREEMTRELRSEIKLVARTIAFAAGDPQAARD